MLTELCAGGRCLLCLLTPPGSRGGETEIRRERRHGGRVGDAARLVRTFLEAFEEIGMASLGGVRREPSGRDWLVAPTGFEPVFQP